MDPNLILQKQKDIRLHLEIKKVIRLELEYISLLTLGPQMGSILRFPEFVIKSSHSQVFPCEFWEIFKDTFFAERLCMTASGLILATFSVHFI